MKKCTKCGTIKELDCFRQIKLKSGNMSYRGQCKECEKEYQKSEKGLMKSRDRCKKYYEKNKTKMRSRRKEYYKENAEECRKHRREYYKNNKDAEKERRKEYRKNNVQLRIKENISRRLRSLVRECKEKTTLEYLGCDIDFFKNYISTMFVEGMSWDNYGEWHLDHIKPCSHFDLTTQENIYKCFHYTNYSPKWAFDNLSKGDRFIG